MGSFFTVLRSKSQSNITRVLTSKTLFFYLLITGFTVNAQEEASVDKAFFRIGILGCHKQFEPAPSLFRYIEAKPDLCLWIGDNVYADTKDDPEFLTQCYDALSAKPAFQELIRTVPYMATWDDHDYGLNNAGKEYALKDTSKAIFRRFWGLEEKILADQPGIYYSQIIEHQEKNIQIIMLDGRYNRAFPNSGGDILGEAQWKWLKKQLLLPADLKIIVSGFQILLDRESGSETWENFPSARQRLFDLIRLTQTEHLLFITGDQHYGEVARLKQALDFDAIELQFAGLNQIERPEFNSYRVSNVIKSKHSYALLDLFLDTTKYDIPHLAFQVFDGLTNERELYYRINMEELGLKLHFSSPTTFVNSTEVTWDNQFSQLDLHYTKDGSSPNTDSPKYLTPIKINQTTTFKIRFFDSSGNPRSKTIEKQYIKLRPEAPLTLTGLQNGLNYKYYEGNFTTLPDFNTLSPNKTGVTQNFKVEEMATRNDHYAILFEGYIEVPEDEVYHFFTYSDDGSKLLINDKLVVNNDGSHSARKRSGQIALKKGLHPIRIEYFEDYEGQMLQVGYQTHQGQEHTLSMKNLFYKP